MYTASFEGCSLPSSQTKVGSVEIVKLYRAGEIDSPATHSAQPNCCKGMRLLSQVALYDIGRGDLDALIETDDGFFEVVCLVGKGREHTRKLQRTDTFAESENKNRACAAYNEQAGS
jgi:hypothetical protein